MVPACTCCPAASTWLYAPVALPPSYMPVCRSCCTPAAAGLPNSVAKTKQALARGYAVVAVSSRDRSKDGRCFGMEADGPAVVEVVSTVSVKC